MNNSISNLVKVHSLNSDEVKSINNLDDSNLTINEIDLLILYWKELNLEYSDWVDYIKNVNNDTDIIKYSVICEIVKCLNDALKCQNSLFVRQFNIWSKDIGEGFELTKELANYLLEFIEELIKLKLISNDKVL